MATTGTVSNSDYRFIKFKKSGQSRWLGKRPVSTAQSQKDTLALIEPKIATADTIKDIPQDEIWSSLLVARAVTNWCININSSLVQVCIISDRSITIQPKTVVGTISPVTAIIPENVVSAVATILWKAHNLETIWLQTFFMNR